MGHKNVPVHFGLQLACFLTNYNTSCTSGNRNEYSRPTRYLISVLKSVGGVIIAWLCVTSQVVKVYLSFNVKISPKKHGSFGPLQNKVARFYGPRCSRLPTVYSCACNVCGGAASPVFTVCRILSPTSKKSILFTVSGVLTRTTNKYTNVLWIRNWLQALWCALNRWQHLSVWNDVMAAIVKVWRQIENPTPSIDAY